MSAADIRDMSTDALEAERDLLRDGSDHERLTLVELELGTRLRDEEESALAIDAVSREVERYIGTVAGIAISSPIQRGHKVEGIVWAIRRQAPLPGRRSATLRWGYSRHTGEVELFCGHYDLSFAEGGADFALRVTQDREGRA